jgi:cystathionine beta-lyase/cystathionine gamma-synthase
LKPPGFATRAIHVGQDPDPSTGSVTVPIYQTSTYAQQDIGVHKGYEYSRTDNPTRTALQEVLASLDEGAGALAFASGMAAEASIMALLTAGDHVVFSDDVYGGTYRLFYRVLRKFGLEFDAVDGTDLSAVEASMRPDTRMVWTESPTNPLLKIVDLAALAEIAHAGQALLVVDNTFASPYLQQPLKLGADIAVYSATKYLGGHSDLVMGAAVMAERGVYDSLKFHQNAIGAVPGPMDCWLLLRGIKTLSLRMDRHEENARAVADYLATRTDAVSRVLYPGLPDHPGHDLAERQMRGFGGIVTVEVQGGLEGASRFMCGLKLFALAESLGGVESLADHPAVMTHASVPKDARDAAGITDGLVRLSVGTEDRDDLLADLEQALG